MGGIFLIDSIRLWLHRRSREKKLQLAATWPTTAAEVNHWAVLPADDEANAFGTPFQIEAGFHFKLNGEYYGGYFRSVAMAVFAEDNKENLPFQVFSS